MSGSTQRLLRGLMAATLLALAAGCQSTGEQADSSSRSGAKLSEPIRIKAGDTPSLTDADGNVWLTERGFVEGATTARPEFAIANTSTPDIYRSERYNMASFSYPLANGKYTVKLHFAETFEGITRPGERVFSFNVEGKEFKDFDIWVKSGGFLRAYIETVKVDIRDGKLDITFTPQVEYPQINGIEIFPGY